MAWLLLNLIYKLKTMKNNLKTTLFAVATLAVLTVSAQKPRPSVAPKNTEETKNKSNSVNDGKTMNSTVPTKSVSNATNLKGQNDVSATQSSSSKPTATTTSITSSKITTSNNGSTKASDKKVVETRRRR